MSNNKEKVKNTYPELIKCCKEAISEGRCIRLSSIRKCKF